MQSTQIAFERAATKVVQIDGCWRFTGALSAAGYGQVRNTDRRMLLAHRLFYEHLVGPIPDGLEIDHLCGFRNCVNPQHLEPVTHAENMRRARRTHCRRGHEFTPENTYISQRKYPRRVCRTCKREWDAARKAA